MNCTIKAASGLLQRRYTWRYNPAVKFHRWQKFSVYNHSCNKLEHTILKRRQIKGCRSFACGTEENLAEKLWSYVHQDVDENDATVQHLYKGLIEGQRAALAQCITLVETSNLKKKAQAQVLMKKVLQFNNSQKQHALNRVKTLRIGIQFSYIVYLDIHRTFRNAISYLQSIFSMVMLYVLIS